MIYASIKARVMLFSRSKLMTNNADRSINSGAYRRCLSRIGVNYLQNRTFSFHFLTGCYSTITYTVKMSVFFGNFVSSNSQLVRNLLALVLCCCLYGCRIEVNVGLGIYDDADIRFLNNTDLSMTFFIKNEVESGNVFDSKFEIATVNSQRFSDDIRYRWLKENPVNQFASQDTNSRLIGQSLTANIRDNRDYWVVSWLLNNNYRLSLFERRQNDTEGEFQVRIFANQELQIDLNNQSSTSIFTQVGQVTPYYSIAQCGDLTVGGIAIDLCQTGEIGGSYLVVVDANGLVVVARE